MTTKTFLSRLLLIGTLSFLASCTSATPPFRSSERPIYGMGYIYGKFILSPSPASCGIGTNLVLLNPNSQRKGEYVIKFNPADQVTAISLIPGEYLVSSIDYISADGSTHSRKTFEKSIRKLQIEKGKAYYLGDYSTKTQCKSTADGGIQYNWAMQPMEYHFTQTTADFENEYIHFQTVEKVPDKKIDEN